jgi:hypothetical protein
MSVYRITIRQSGDKKGATARGRELFDPLLDVIGAAAQRGQQGPFRQVDFTDRREARIFFDRVRAALGAATHGRAAYHLCQHAEGIGDCRTAPDLEEVSG